MEFNVRNQPNTVYQYKEKEKLTWQKCVKNHAVFTLITQNTADYTY